MSGGPGTPPDPSRKVESRLGPGGSNGPEIDSALYTELPAARPATAPRTPPAPDKVAVPSRRLVAPTTRTRTRNAGGGIRSVFLIDVLALLLVAATGPAAWLWIDSSHPAAVTPSGSAPLPSASVAAVATPSGSLKPGTSAVKPSPKLAFGDGTWSQADSLPLAVWGSGGTLLKDGRFLVAGGAVGASSSQASAGVYIYDPVSGHWATATSLLQARAYPMVVTLNDGSVLVAGGSRNQQPLDTAERYNPASGTWVAAGRMNLPRSQGSLVVLADGRALATGGGIQGPPGWDSTASAEIYDPVRNNWSIAPPMAVARARHSATVLPDGEVLVAGGATTFHGEGGTVTAAAEIYNPHSNSWRRAASMSIPRYVQQAVLLTDGRVLVAGGWSFTSNSDPSKASAEIYDPNSDKWTAAAPMGSARAEFTMERLPDGRALAIAGIDRDYRLLDTTEIFDPSTGAWQPSGKLPVTLMWPVVTILSDGRVLLAGGATDIASNGRTAGCELYAPKPR